ncbi:MAG TPA: hypothetical protein VGD59_13505 [Acidisarcina sp.]
MKLTIDNLAGAGPIDYTTVVSSAAPLSIERTLNAPSICSFILAQCGATLPAPSRNARLVVTGDQGACLFTGYLAIEPALQYAGAGIAGPVYQLAVSAVSDEFLLDKQNLPQTNGTAGQSVSTVFRSLTSRVGAALLNLDTSLQTLNAGHFVPNPGEKWSQNAGALASTARAAYRFMAGTVSVTPVGAVAHPLNEFDGSLKVAALTASRARMLANDVTVCGQAEPTAYVTELFQGDGATALFELTQEPYIPRSASQIKPLKDNFQASVVNPLIWSLNDSSSAISITSNGLTVNGGNGIDGQTTIATIDQFEIGGSLIIETDGVLLGSGGTGTLCGLYAGSGSTLSTCLAGFHVRQLGGSTVIAPILNGVEVGTTYTPAPGELYTLRLRLHCSEVQRVMQSYQGVAAGALSTFGGAQLPCLANVVIELQDVTAGANGAVTVLYDGPVSSAPAACTFMPLNSLTLAASIRNATISQTGSAWVVSQPLGGAVVTRRIGPVTNGSQCKVQRNGKLRFYPGSIPAAGELITVTYRTSGRAVARLSSAASIAAETRAAMPGISRWTGSVVRPAARSSADCENAALAMLSFTADRNAAWQGVYTAYNLQNGSDVWPGDVLAVASPSAGVTTSLVVRSVRVDLRSGVPETAKYTIQFANDWAEELSMKLSAAVPSDAWIPPLAHAGVAVLANLLSLTTGVVSGASIPISVGMNAPVGGGFEVRRSDWAFRPGNDPDLVLRSPVPNFTIPREGTVEQYYIRMYDASMPPLYSRFSSAIFVNI